MKLFPGGFEKKDYSGFDKSRWPPKTLKAHQETTRKLDNAKTRAEIESIEMRYGVKYSILSEPPYFDPIRFTILA